MRTCAYCKHANFEYVDIDGSGRRDYPMGECDYDGECCEENNYAGWEATE